MFLTGNGTVLQAGGFVIVPTVASCNLFGFDLNDSTTSVTLLLRLRDSKDEAAWREFVDRYGGRIYSWCLSRRLQQADAEDVTQSVLIRLSRYIERFQYDAKQSFRGWLRRVTENAIRDFARDEAKQPARGGSSVHSILQTEPNRRDLADALEQVFDLELLDEAKKRVKSRVTEIRWASWEASIELPRTAKQLAQELGISVGTLYANKNQIQKMIQAEVAKLDQGLSVHSSE